MAVKLHRCGNMWAKFGRHPCWTVQKALDEAGVEYEVVKESWPSRKGRTAVIEGTGESRHRPRCCCRLRRRRRLTASSVRSDRSPAGAFRTRATQLRPLQPSAPR